MNLRYQMRKAMYVFEMAEHKDRIKPETKVRLKKEFEDSVIAYALSIEDDRIAQGES